MKELEREWLIEKRGHLTQQEAADLIGISRGAYANIEVGNRNPSVKVAKRIADAFGFHWTIFFTEEVVDSKQKRSAV
ncbi:XRE family transcriptional regulator [Planomicrobium sp. MB-3u-38]|nr:XRE family transcriptional regulator [Planomicrobium sp. MB-3u-38]